MHAGGTCQRKRLEAWIWYPYSRLMRNQNPFRYFKTSPEIIRLAVMMYVRFPLSLRNVEDLLHERGIDICHETVRHWWNRFGPMFASEIRRNRASRLKCYSNWQWHVDEVFVKINGEQYYLWRAVDHGGEVLESYVTKRRDKAAALAFLRKAMKRYGKPQVVVTDRLASYKAALREINCAHKQEVGRWQNNRAENSHLTFPKKGTSDAAVQANAKFAEVRVSSLLRLQPLQSRKTFKLAKPIQTSTQCCTG